jgi:hypothetical protein
MKELTEEEKKLTAFSLFSMGMKIGPPSFPKIEAIMQKLELDEQFSMYANDWITHAKAHKQKTEQQHNDIRENNSGDY